MNTAWPDCLTYLERECNYGREAGYSPIDVRYALVLWVLADCCAAKTILEIGIGPESVSGCTFIHNLAQRGGGSLISVDIDPKLPQAKYRDLAREKGVFWAQVYGDSITEAIALDPALRVDLLYIDGDHDAAHAAGDLAKFLVHLRPGGYLVIDDFPPDRGVGEGRAELERIVPYFLHLAHNAPAGNGRLVWQKPL